MTGKVALKTMSGFLLSLLLWLLPPAVFIIDDGQGGQWYGFPEHGPQPGFKIGRYNHLRQTVHPDHVSR
jgi:hypothetical protein